MEGIALISVMLVFESKLDVNPCQGGCEGGSMIRTVVRWMESLEWVTRVVMCYERMHLPRPASSLSVADKKFI